jgi:peptide/nickel transport system substrate-binding protein
MVSLDGRAYRSRMTTAPAGRKRWSIRAAAVAMTFVLTLAASCTGDSAETPAPSRGPVGGTLRLGMTNPAYWGMDPLREWNAATWELFRCCLLRTMMSYDVAGDASDIRPIPDLAAAPPDISTDGLTWTFHLREGIAYAPPLDDVEVTSQDFVRAITRAAHAADPDAPALEGYLDMIEGFDAYVRDEATSIVGLQTPDRYTLRITTTRLDATLLYMLALPITAPIPPQPGSESAPFGVASGYDDEAAEPNGGAESYGPVLVASGPYMFEGADQLDHSLPPEQRTPPSGFTPWQIELLPEELRVVSDGAITLVRNPSWNPDSDPLRAARADRLEVVGGEPDALFPQMQAGEIDLVFDADPPPAMIRAYQDDPELRPLIQSPVGSLGLTFASFNVALPPFDDVAVRRAVAYGMDRAELAEMFNPGTRPAQHFGTDTFEASLLASWAGIPGAGAHGDASAAQAAMRGSRYATGDRCTDPSCDGVRILMLDSMRPGVPAFRETLVDLGITPEIRLAEAPYDCLEPEVKIGMCVGMGWFPDFPSAAQYLGSFFASDGELPTTRLGATPAELRRWGYEVTHVPSLDEEIDRCERELGSEQAPCWSRLDQYVVTQLMPAVPMGFVGTLRLSSPDIGQFTWDEVYLQPALERIPAPSG